jgi:pyruvate-formate lyase-activating enzyme
VTRPPAAKRGELLLDLALTARCPLRCRFCTVEKAAAGVELSAEAWCALIAAVARRRVIRLVSLEGGEPLVRPDLPEILAAALAHASAVKLVTGGAVPFEALPLALARDPRFTLEVSVDGPAAVHDRLRDGSFAAAWEFIRRGRRAGLRLRLRAVVSTVNIAVLEEWLAAVDRELSGTGPRIGFRFDVLIDPASLAGAGGPLARPGWRTSGGRGWVPAPSAVAALYHRLRRRRFRRLVLEQQEPFRGCGIGRLPALAFDPAGRYSLCCEAPGCLGSLGTATVEEILARLDREMDRLPCRRCAELGAERCDGCWTGRKCGLVGAWGLGDCRALAAMADGREALPGAGRRACP